RTTEISPDPRGYGCGNRTRRPGRRNRPWSPAAMPWRGRSAVAAARRRRPRRAEIRDVGSRHPPVVEDPMAHRPVFAGPCVTHTLLHCGIEFDLGTALIVEVQDRGREGLTPPRPPNRTGGFPAYGSPVGSFFIESVSQSARPCEGRAA